ncbi:bifunctional proline dehydrogenase/L-glutamate gamma-semialdehyde dehydrogenase [bacterium]|nr:bifunctional proline dehydrogenase/L-glutamate gamma-semialdehyde dehydrogenase [bacterium]
MNDLKSLEPSIARRARELLEAVDRREGDLSVGATWEDKIMDWSLADPDRKTRILRFIDVFPAIDDDPALVDHLKSYFPRAGHRLPEPLRAGLKFGGGLLTSRWVGAAARLMMRKMARRFIGGESLKEAAATMRRLKADGYESSLDFLGEATLTEPEAEQNLETIVAMIEHLSKDRAGLSQTNLSIKCSSLTSYFDPVDPEEVSRRLLPRLRVLLRSARTHGVFLHFDAEQYEICDLTLDLLMKVLREDEFRNFSDVGVVLQAYLRDAAARVSRLEEFCGGRSPSARPLTVRLVKGAYWDSEVIRARSMGWLEPVYLRKSETDAAFERLTLSLMDSPAKFRVAIASHNLRGIAAALAMAESLGLPRDRIEFQFLFGMARATRKVIADLGYTVRVYTPYGQLIPGMAYLVRRLLENSSNESFLRHRRLGKLAADDLLRNPHDLAAPPAVSGRPSPGIFENTPAAAFHQKSDRDSLKRMVDRALSEPPESIGPIVNGRRQTARKKMLSLNPSHPSRPVAEVDLAGAALAREAVAGARREWQGFQRSTARDRANILKNAADLMERHREELTALEICEAGKPWFEARGDVDEAIDYLRFYALEAERLESGVRFQPGIPGETNAGVYRPRGVVAVISPWNFPLAIPAGQVSAAIAAGNAVVFKPAEQTPLIAYRLFEILRQAGLPDGVLQFLPGIGGEIGPALVEHPDVDVIAFTGSRAVGEDILRRAAASFGPSGPKRVIAEMGGKNAVIIDSDADFDLAVAECLRSAFDYAGQKCSALSRLILLDDIYDEFLNRFAEAALTWPLGPAETPSTRISPLIDADAVKRVTRHIETANREGRWILPPDQHRLSAFKEGFFVPPGIVAVKSPAADVAQEEIFGPIVTVLSAKNLDDAFDIANRTPYALTAGIFSRHPRHIERFRSEVDAGNLYINRAITGAKVGRQPFGGHRRSGVGSKAGGPDYLQQFCLPVTCSENISRHGFSPDVSA